MKSRFRRVCIVSKFGILAFCIGALSARAADPFAEGVRTTDPLSPEEQRKSFTVPPDFEVKLFAAEPVIAKPMNMAFDDKGRMWVTTSLEYPFPASLNQKGRDRIVVLEDKDGDGKAESAKTFVDGLNIPTGIYPYKNGVIAWSIPNLWYFQDTDGDGQADKRTVLYGPLGWERDTHGMNSSFRRGWDGWLYITHGFNNDSVVKGGDGSQIRLNSGNVYRVQVDGSRVEGYSWGQVNPFGLAFDPIGNLFSADCHSAPIYQLLRDAYYPSFGKPHDGLGFGPTLMEHSHGSTAIAGIVYISDDRWPVEFRDNILIGNVMTSRINRDTLIERGTTKVAKEEPDFMSSKDPWFRPMDLQFGPDGALYVADFYNRIIGHYEVPLTHPGRDRERGRIWRVSYKGSARRTLNFGTATVQTLIDELADSNPTRSSLALERLVERGIELVKKPLLEIMRSEEAAWRHRAYGLWVLHRLGALDTRLMEEASKDSSREVRVHLMRVLSESSKWNSKLRHLAVGGLSDPDAWVQRAAADALNRHPAIENVEPLLKLLANVPSYDPHLIHGVRMSIRSQLKLEGAFRLLKGLKLSASDRSRIADIAVAVQSADAASFLFSQLNEKSVSKVDQERFVRHVARHGVDQIQEKLGAWIPNHLGEDLDLQLSLFKAMEAGLAQRGAGLGPASKSWAARLITSTLGEYARTEQNWRGLRIEGRSEGPQPWLMGSRKSSDGDLSGWFASSLPPGGESLTGILRSREFVAPPKLSFYLAGHDGYPDKPAQKLNLVRLVDAQNLEILRIASPPRNDVAQRVDWDLSDLKERKVYLEVVDGDTGNAYAWLAFGRMTPESVSLPKVGPSVWNQRLVAVSDLAGRLGDQSFLDTVNGSGLFKRSETDLEVKAAVARVIALLQPTAMFTTLAPLISDATLAESTRRLISESMANPVQTSPYDVVLLALQKGSRQVQVRLAQILAGNPTGAEKLLGMIEEGRVSKGLINDKLVVEKLRATLGTNASMQSRIDTLAKAEEAPESGLVNLIEQRKKTYNPGNAQPTLGVRVFNQNCSVCHQIDGRGGLVGPQLDGIGNRGLDRILEDIIDPNRNVDVAFKSQLFVMKDGDVISGLLRREEGETIVIADATGKEQTINRSAIQERRASSVSLMPENFGELLSQDDLNHLVSYLLSKGAAGR